MVVKYISFDLTICQLHQKFHLERNFTLPENDKNIFYASKSNNFDLRYFSVFSILIIYTWRITTFECYDVI